MTKLPSKKEAKISELVFDKFPHMNFYNTRKPDYDLEKHKTFDFKAEVQKREEYRNELYSYSNEEIDKLYEPLTIKNEKERILEIEKAENELFNKTKMLADYDYWNKAGYWTVDEFVALSFGKNPELINKEYVGRNTFTNSAHHFFAEFEFPKKYLKRLELISRSTEKFIESDYQEKMKQIFNKKPIGKIALPPKYYINWAKNKDIALPKEMSEIAVDDSSVKKMEELSKNYSSLPEDTNKIIQSYKEKEKEISSLKIQLKNKTDQFDKLQNEKVLGITDKRSLLKMIYGMATTGYSWDSEAKKSNAITEITTDINTNCNKPISDDTVRKWLKEAKKLADELELED